MFLPRTISGAIDKIARTAFGKDWGLYAALLDHWPEIVGREYAHNTTPVKITFPAKQKEAQRTGGTLVVRLPKGLTMEFTFKVDQIRQRITGYFGYEAISKIVFEPAAILPPTRTKAAPDPKALAAVHEAVEDISEDDLREALKAFGEAVVKDGKR